MPQNCETCGDPMTQEEYISEKDFVSRCRNLLWNETNLGQTLNIVSNGQGGEIEFNGKRYSVKWNRDDSVISGMIDGSNLFELQTISVNGSRELLSKMLIIMKLYLYRILRLQYKRFSVLMIRLFINKDRLFEPNGYGGLVNI